MPGLTAGSGPSSGTMSVLLWTNHASSWELFSQQHKEARSMCSGKSQPLSSGGPCWPSTAIGMDQAGSEPAASTQHGLPWHRSRAPTARASPPFSVFHQGSLKVKTTERKVKPASPPWGKGKAAAAQVAQVKVTLCPLK